MNIRFTPLLWILAFAGAVSLLLNLDLLPREKINPPAVSRSSPIYGSPRPITPIPTNLNDIDPRKAMLGKQLFLSPLLSADNTVSCFSCHNLYAGGADNRPLSIGVNGASGDINSPTVFNSALAFTQFWDGRANTLEEQINGPVHNPVEMNSNWPDIIAKLQSDPKFTHDFNAVYPEGMSEKTLIDAIASFEKTLLTPNSPFDRYLRGQEKAISSRAKKGYALFSAYGCTSCHQGVNVGGNLFQYFGIMNDYFSDRKNIKPLEKSDFGRYNVTGKEEDRFLFKVPSLRNIAKTAPYFHDGLTHNLPGAISVMAHYQLGRTLTETEINLIEEFLKTLSADPPAMAETPAQ